MTDVSSGLNFTPSQEPPPPKKRMTGCEGKRLLQNVNSRMIIAVAFKRAIKNLF
jgi:hypothetical protein